MLKSIYNFIKSLFIRNCWECGSFNIESKRVTEDYHLNLWEHFECNDCGNKHHECVYSEY